MAIENHVMDAFLSHSFRFYKKILPIGNKNKAVHFSNINIIKCKNTSQGTVDLSNSGQLWVVLATFIFISAHTRPFCVICKAYKIYDIIDCQTPLKTIPMPEILVEHQFRPRCSPQHVQGFWGTGIRLGRPTGPPRTFRRQAHLEKNIILGGLSDVSREVSPSTRCPPRLGLWNYDVDVENRLGDKFDEFTVVSYRTQVVAGTNYFAKVRIGSNKYIHIRVYRDLIGVLVLSGVQEDKTHDEPIVYF
ncbi:unnamed protein product, partial [Meganyctiphanes norvegica]